MHHSLGFHLLRLVFEFHSAHLVFGKHKRHFYAAVTFNDLKMKRDS